MLQLQVSINNFETFAKIYVLHNYVASLLTLTVDKET